MSQIAKEEKEICGHTWGNHNIGSIECGQVLAGHLVTLLKKRDERVIAKLKEKREEEKLSLRVVAEKIGISASYLHDIERGRRNMSDRVRQKIEQLIAIL